jgi:hypothetical protein
MEKSGQRLAIKIFFMKGMGAKATHKGLAALLAPTAYAPRQIKEWRARFTVGDLSRQDQFRAGRSLHIFGKALSDFLDEFPVATAGVLAQNFNHSKRTIKEIFQKELGLHRFSRTWVPHSLSDAQKVDMTRLATELLCPPSTKSAFFFMDCHRGRVLVYLFVSI